MPTQQTREVTEYICNACGKAHPDMESAALCENKKVMTFAKMPNIGDKVYYCEKFTETTSDNYYLGTVKEIGYDYVEEIRADYDESLHLCKLTIIVDHKFTMNWIKTIWNMIGTTFGHTEDGQFHYHLFPTVDHIDHVIFMPQ